MAKNSKVESMTCAEAPDIVITQDVLDLAALPWKNIGFTQRLREVRVILGKHVALVSMGQNEQPYLQCACDFHCVREARGVRKLVSMTFQCERKKAWQQERLKEVGSEYMFRGISIHDALPDLCDRVWNKGDYVGQSEGDWLYVQHVAEMFGVENHDVLAVVDTLRSEKRCDLSGMVLVPYIEQEPDIANNERTPMVSWECMDPGGVAGLVWAAKLDERFQIEVQRKHDAYEGVLCIFDHAAGDVLLHAVDVGLSYGAQFGPDVGDIAYWESLVTAFIDEKFPKKT